MRLIKAPRDTVLRPLQIVSGIVERRSTLPILANILIRKEAGSISVVASDTQVEIITRAAIGAGADSAAVTVEAKKLLDIIRALPEGGDIDLSVTNKRMTVQSGKSRFSMQTLPAEDFPTMVRPEEYKVTVAMPQRTLRQLLRMVQFAMANNDIRYYLNGMLLVTSGRTVTAVATDGHRLAMCSIDTDTEYPDQNVIIPRKSINELQRIMGDVDDPVTLSVADSAIRFEFNDVEMISKLVEGKYPDYHRVVPKDHKNTFEIDRSVLMRAMQRAAIMTSDKFKGVAFTIAPGSLKIRAANQDQEEAVEEIDIDYGGPELDVGFNVTFLLDVLNTVEGDTVRVALGDATSSALITDPTNKDFKYVVMPLRI